MANNFDKIFNQLVAEDSIPESASVLKRELINFFEFLGQVMSDNPSLFDSEYHSDLIMILEFITRSDALSMMDQIIKKLLPYSEQIKHRDQSFFEKNVLKLFSNLPQDKVYFVYELVRNEKIDQEDKDDIWNYLQTFVMLAEKNKKSK